MMNTDPDTQEAISQEENPVNPNLLNPLQSWREAENSTTGVGFSCIYNSQFPSVDSGIESVIARPQLYAECFIADSSSLGIFGIVWTYNQSGPGNGNYTIHAPEYCKTLRSRSS